jgi:hypothetical protein
MGTVAGGNGSAERSRRLPTRMSLGCHGLYSTRAKHAGASEADAGGLARVWSTKLVAPKPTASAAGVAKVPILSRASVSPTLAGVITVPRRRLALRFERLCQPILSSEGLARVVGRGHAPSSSHNSVKSLPQMPLWRRELRTNFSKQGHLVTPETSARKRLSPNGLRCHPGPGEASCSLFSDKPGC